MHIFKKKWKRLGWEAVLRNEDRISWDVRGIAKGLIGDERKGEEAVSHDLERADQQQEVLQEIEQWIQERIGQYVSIQKIEEEDVDQVQLQLEGVRIGQQSVPDPDDYVSAQALILSGTGHIESAVQQALTLELPQNAYEVPITQDMMVEQANGMLQISTERAVYRLQSVAQG